MKALVNQKCKKSEFLSQNINWGFTESCWREGPVWSLSVRLQEHLWIEEPLGVNSNILCNWQTRIQWSTETVPPQKLKPECVKSVLHAKCIVSRISPVSQTYQSAPLQSKTSWKMLCGVPTLHGLWLKMATCSESDRNGNNCVRDNLLYWQYLIMTKNCEWYIEWEESQSDACHQNSVMF